MKRTNRQGEVWINNDGETLHIIEYNGINDCTIRFGDGTILKNIQYHNIISRDDYKTIRLSIFQNLKTDYLPDVHHLDVSCDAPLFHQTFRFFREKYMLSGEIYIFKNIWNFDIEDISNSIQLYTSDIMCYNSYEEAELECLVKLINIVKKQNVK